MPESADDKRNAAPDHAEPSQTIPPEEERMEDEEKILAGRNDVNYPALLTKDVAGG
jgi:hypothetical protein